MQRTFVSSRTAKVPATMAWTTHTTRKILHGRGRERHSCHAPNCIWWLPAYVGLGPVPDPGLFLPGESRCLDISASADAHPLEVNHIRCDAGLEHGSQGINRCVNNLQKIIPRFVINKNGHQGCREDKEAQPTHLRFSFFRLELSGAFHPYINRIDNFLPGCRCGRTGS